MLLNPISFLSMLTISVGMFFLAIPTFADATDTVEDFCVLETCVSNH